MGDSPGLINQAQSDSIPISSDSCLDDIEHHFRVTAGPGAGKTFWLVNHVQNVANRSNRITPCAKIAVISYTNVAVREILNRLGPAAVAVEVSTIHSFLFRNLVRPYLHLFKDEMGECFIEHALADNHDEHYPSYKKVEAWLTYCGQRQLLRLKDTHNWLLKRLCNLSVRISSDDRVIFEARKLSPRDKPIARLLTPDNLLAYKKLYWSQGILDHDDVLYFALRVQTEFPQLAAFVCARFPYLFIDEFQDTLPVQAMLVEWLAKAGTTVGVIGDPEQAIFEFLDASPVYFNSYSLPGFTSYQMVGNRRSSESILRITNRIRYGGLEQESLRHFAGEPPRLYVGNLTAALAHARQELPEQASLLVLARIHKRVASVRLGMTGAHQDHWKELHEADVERARFLKHLITSLELARQGMYDIAIQGLMKGITKRGGFRNPLRFDGDANIVARRSVAFRLLEQFSEKHTELVTGTAEGFYAAISEMLPGCLSGLSVPGVRAGKFKTAAQCSYIALTETIRTPEETRVVRTVHQAKGAEAEAVFVVLEDEQIDHILNPGQSSEEQRITYVAVSRARDRLYLFSNQKDCLQEFENVGFETMVMD